MNKQEQDEIKNMANTFGEIYLACIQGGHQPMDALNSAAFAIERWDQFMEKRAKAIATYMDKATGTDKP